MKRLIILMPLIGLGCSEPQTVTVPPKVVTTQTVQAEQAATVMGYSGEVRARHEATLGFRIGGKIVARAVEVGDRVKAGQVLARVDAADLEAQARAAGAERQLANAELKRFEALAQQGFVSVQAVDVRRAQRDAAVARAAVADNQSRYAALVADADGVVSAVLADPGQVVGPGQPVVRVARTDALEVAIAVPESRIETIGVIERSGGVPKVTLWAAPKTVYPGRIREISPQADPVTRTYAVRVALTNADAAVRLGMTATVVFDAPPAAPVWRVPPGALFQQGTQPAVWVLDGNTVRLRPVTVAELGETTVRLSAGVHDGEEVVAAGAHKLIDGEVVRRLTRAAP